MSKPCRPRTSCLKSLLNSQSFPQISKISPLDPTCLDDTLEYLCARDPATDEVIVSTMDLMSISQRAKAIIDATFDKISVTIETTLSTEEKTIADARMELTHAMELLMSMGFLAGTAIGFAAGLVMEEDDGDDYDDPFESPMI